VEPQARAIRDHIFAAGLPSVFLVPRRQVTRRGLPRRPPMPVCASWRDTGKTTALTQLGRTHERGTQAPRRPAAPAAGLYVTVPPAATARMLAVEFARFFALEFAVIAAAMRWDRRDGPCSIRASRPG
jgi:hypothetical protein